MSEPSQRKRHYKKRGRSLDFVALQDIQSLLGKQTLKRALLIEYLHLIQDHYACLTLKHLHALAHLLKISLSEIFEVASFYHHFDIVKDGETPPPKLTIRVCESLSCELAGSKQLLEDLQPSEHIRIQKVPCVGHCAQAPIAVVGTNPIAQATKEKVDNAIQNKQIHAAAPEHALSYAGYVKNNGYQLYQKIQSDSELGKQVFQAMEDSNLRGLGGAGFPVGRKWRIVAAQEAPRLMAVNIDEGEPGTFKDRHYLEQDPHRFLEGMLIAAHLVGIDAIYIYLRDEYAGLRILLKQALQDLQNHHGDTIPPIELRRGAGAYICGEESAMIESIEGKRGMPRLRPPYVAEVGLFGRPTLEHNMESLYWVREIAEKGAAWFTSHGRHGRKGLRSFSVSGRVKKPGVYLAPAGITLQELIDEYAGGMQDGHTLKGYFPGGASGGLLPARMANIPLDFDTLNKHGCFIGSAAIIVFSDQDSARDLALNAMQFFKDESCGQCTPCRVGSAKAVQLMQQPAWNTKLMNELAITMQDASICGLGQAAPNPMQCVIRYFPEEVLA